MRRSTMNAINFNSELVTAAFLIMSRAHLIRASRNIANAKERLYHSDAVRHSH